MKLVLDALLEQAKLAHQNHVGLADFVDFPASLEPGNYLRQVHPVESAMRGQEWDDGPLDEFRDKFTQAASIAQWRKTYEGTKIDPDFMARFGCYCMIGDGGFWTSPDISSYVVYMPPGLHYPWHHHPAEEAYLVLAGEAEFQLKDGAVHSAKAGDLVFHPSNQPHATTTTDQPMMAYVVWRNELGTAPVWSDPELY